MEFLPTDEVTQAMSAMFGLTEDESSSETDDSTQSRRLADEESGSLISKENNSDNSDIIKRLGVMLVIALTIAIFLVIFWLLKYLTHRDYKWYSRYMTLHDKIFYNLFIRYIFQSTLKIQFASVMTLMLLSDWKTISNIVQGVLAYLLLILMQACPFVFAAILYTQFKNLNRYKCQKKIGSMYTGTYLDGKEYYPVSYSVTFLIRRSVFIIITFKLIDYPAVQV